MTDGYFPDEESAEPLIIPYQQLSADALSAVIEEYITREGTDYGLIEKAVDTQIAAAKKQLEDGKVLIVFDPVSESCQMIEAQMLESYAKP